MNKWLNKEVAESVRVVAWPLAHRQSYSLHFAKWGTVDLTKITVPMAKALIQSGFPFLEMREEGQAQGQAQDLPRQAARREPRLPKKR